MKRIFPIVGIFAIAAAAFCALDSKARRNQQEFQRVQANWMEQTQELAHAQSEANALSARVQVLKAAVEDAALPASHDSALIDLLSTNDFNRLSLPDQARLIRELGMASHPSNDFVFAPKKVLANSQVKAFRNVPNAWQLSPAAQQILAITPDEQKSVEEAFAEALQQVGDWARSHVQRSGASNDMLVSYTIPIDLDFENGITNRLFSTVGDALGAQRTELLQHYFENFRIDEDGAIAVNTNKLEVWRVPGKAGLFYREGWEMGKWSAINTYPEPIHTNRFPAAFSYIFPGGWQELAQREGLELVEPPAAN